MRNTKTKLSRLADYQKAILSYYRDYHKEMSIFRLQQEMLTLGVCIKCGTSSRSWSSDKGHYPCRECGFWITPKEVEIVTDDYDYGKINKRIQLRILNRRLRCQKRC